MLIVGVAVDGHHRRVPESERVAYYLDHRHEAVGRARRVRYHVVLAVVVLVGVYAHDERDVLALSWRRDDDFAGAALDVLVCVGRVGEPAGRFENDIDTELAPWQRGGVALGENLHIVSVDAECSLAVGDVAIERAVDGIVLEEVRQRLCVSEVIDSDEVDVCHSLFKGGADYLPSDSSKAVDANTNCHVSILAKACRPLRGLARM